MEQTNQNNQTQQQNSDLPPKVVADGVNKKPRVVRLRRAVLACIITALVTVLISSAGLSAAFLIGKNYSTNSLEANRQTIVEEGNVIADVAQKVGPSVVSIVTEQQSTVDSLYFGRQTRTSQAAGTGVIIDSNGLVLTNKHVVPTTTSTVTVVTSDGTNYEGAEIIGRDPLNDIAVIKVKNPKNFVAAKLGDSEKVRTGQKVIAIGNALGQFQNTVTSGIISGIGRPIEAGDRDSGESEQLTNLFQTDAAINSGNSGGPLLNFNGEVIGINTAIAADAQNIGFSIPINEVKGVIQSVKTTGKLSRPFLGVRYVMLNAEIAKELGVSVQTGAYVSKDADSIVEGSPAQKAGITAGDIITKVNNIQLSQTTSLASAVGRSAVGETVELTVIRDGKEQKIKLTLAEAPAA